MSNRNGAGGYKGEIPPQFFGDYPAILNIEETNKPIDQFLYPSVDNQPSVLALSTYNTPNINGPFQVTTILNNTGGDRGSFYWTGVSGQYFPNPSLSASCPYGGGAGVTKHRVNIDFGQSVTLNSVILLPSVDFSGPSPGVFGTTTSITSTTGTNIVNDTFSTNVFVQRNFTNTTSRFWFLECNFPGAGCGGCGSTFTLFGVRTSDNIWLPVEVIPYTTTKPYDNALSSTPYFFLDGNISTLDPDPWITRQTQSTIYTAVRTPTGVDFGGNGIIQISGIASDTGRPYVGQTISGATSGATGQVKYVDTAGKYAYPNIASGVLQSSTIVYEPTSVASFATGEKVYSLSSTKPEPRMVYGQQQFTNQAVLKLGSGIIQGSGSLATVVNNNDWYCSSVGNFYLLATGVPNPNTSNVLGGFSTGLSSQVYSNFYNFYSASGTVLASGRLYQNVLFQPGSGSLNLDYRFTGLYAGASRNPLRPILPGSGGWY